MNMTLHAVADDFSLNALYDTPRSEGTTIASPAYIVDESGNYLVDESGNRIIGYYNETVYPQTLHAEQDDFNLRAE